MPQVCVLQVNVADMDVAIRFYVDVLGFEIESRDHYPHIVVLSSGAGIPFILNKVNRSTQIDYPDVAQTVLNFSTPDLAATMAELGQKGVEFIHAAPQPCPVGVYAAFRDPFGNVHEFLEWRLK
jgi:catechol 2,3-dioxygenase-like lactoylglutathione lyase family enzyme